MNVRKGETFTYCILIVLFLILISMLYMVHDSIKHNEIILDEACQELGYETYLYMDDFRFCEDIEGNLYYVSRYENRYGKYGLYLESVKIKPITVGYVEVKDNLGGI